MSTQVTLGFQVAQRVVVKDEPFEMPTYHCPVCRYRPMMSVMPSPLKSPTLTSTQVTLGFQAAHMVVLKLEPLDMPVHQWPPCKNRPVMSVFLSPVKSPTLTSTQVTLGFHMAHKVVVNPVDPLEIPTYHWPPCRYRPTMSALPSPLKSPTWTSTQVTLGFQVAQSVVVKPSEP